MSPCLVVNTGPVECVTSAMFGEDSVKCYPHVVSLLKQQSVHFPEVILAVSPERLLLGSLNMTLGKNGYIVLI